MKPLLHVLTGPTAVGKTEWALRWAEARGAEIVSCDSLLFYRGMDIGTAKPTAAERARVPHHLIDLCGVTERMDITAYVAAARRAVTEIAARGRAVLVTGGSGFYLKSFFAPVADEVAVSAELRAEVAGLALAEAVAQLATLNPGGRGAMWRIRGGCGGRWSGVARRGRRWRCWRRSLRGGRGRLRSGGSS